MKYRAIALIIALGLPGLVFAESVRIGIIGTEEIAKSAETAGNVGSFSHGETFRGAYWEVISNHVGFGMTTTARFSQIPAVDSAIAPDRTLVDWLGGLDLRYHFLERKAFDPFVEGQLGCAGRVDATDYEAKGFADPGSSRMIYLSIYGQVGAGIAFRFHDLHIGVKADYRFDNGPVTGTSIAAFPLSRFSSGIFGGLSF
ncbi:MAG TPA: hypothetical protein VMW87_02970 [Spirochaetia bacterium]|nr:hypothetical protein [Spirochaetia bacterium]